MGMFGGLGDFAGSLGLPGGTSGTAIFGSKPVVPKPVDEALKSQKDTQTLLPGAEKQATQIDTFNQSELERMLELSAPGLFENMGIAGKDIKQMLSGVLSDSDAAAQQRRSIGDALSGGFLSFGAGGAGTNLVLRDLGIAQQQQIDRGLTSLKKWTKEAESLTAPRFDITSMFPTWKDEYSADWQKSLIDAAPDPVARGRSDEWNALIGEVLSVYGGGAGFKGGYTPNYSGGGGGGGGEIGRAHV